MVSPVTAIELSGLGSSLITGDTVTIQASLRSADGQLLSGRRVTWSTSDPEVATITSGREETRATLEARGPGEARITAVCEGASRALTVEVVNLPPVASIDAPTDGASFLEGQMISFRGSGEDLEDRTLPGHALVWTSDMDGQIGTGQTFSNSNLSLGTHAIMLMATDTHGATDSVSISINVMSINEAPSAAISAPADSSTFKQTEPIAFRGSATDLEDGTLIGDALVWTSDIDGEIGRGESFERGGLSGGTHTIVLTAQDTRGFTGRDSVSISISLSFAQLTTGGFHTCGLTSQGIAYCWGYNQYGALGDGTTTHRNTPTKIESGPNFAALTAGFYHTCGLTSGGTAYCWGQNYDGELGDGTTTSRRIPTAVSGGLTFTALSAGGEHTCGLTSDGTAYCWGDNFHGQLGDGTTTDRSTPTAVSGGLSFAALSAGRQHTCGLTSDGAAYCWGNNYSGMLGDGTTTDRWTPTAVEGELSFATVSALGLFHTCGVSSDGTAYCWGFNAYGQLGDGTTMSRWTPTAVSGGLSFRMLSASPSYHTCGVTSDKTPHCWGDNDYGQLGDGTTINRQTPTAVSGGLNFATVSAGGDYACGLTGDGAAHCWGRNSSGQLGDGTTTDRLTPIPVSPPE